MRQISAAAPRFWPKVAIGGLLDCWLWRGSTSTAGYGQFSLVSRGMWTKVQAHRYAYEDAYGPIPEGLHLDHLCRNTRCVNPAHLEAVTCAENIRRGIGPSAVNARKTHCDKGHAFTPENTYVTKVGDRNCRACRREHESAYLPTYVPKVTHCKRGHPYNEANSYISKSGMRTCRTCQRDLKRAKYIKVRSA